MPKFLLRLEDGEPVDPAAAVFEVTAPNWEVGDTFTTGRGAEWRTLAIDTEIAEELEDFGFNGVFTLRPL
jgi:hypothetical protein